MKWKLKSFAWIRKIEQATVVRTIRNGLINIIPVLTIGAFALILKTFPVDAYQKAITTFAGGFFLELFDLVYNATFGVLSVYMTYSISRSYFKLKADSDAVFAGAAISSLLSFFILAGANLESFGTGNMGPKSIFLAILTGLGASALYLAFNRFFRTRRKTLFSSGADREFNRMLSMFVPIALVAICVALLNEIVIRIFNVDSFRGLLIHAFNRLFSHGKVGFFKGFFFVLLSSVLWFFGIHGSDTLEEVMQTYFAPGLAANQAAIAAGSTLTAVLTKEFFDCFVLMGGCGSAICLLIAILIFSRNRARRGLGLTATFPMLFNINELMVFGLPIIFNPIMLIPFLVVPLVCYSVSYLALSLGIVPLISNSVEWTTPILLGGFHATGSIAGALLQLVNVAVGVLIYMPFVRLLDHRTAEEETRNYNAFMDFFRKNENNPEIWKFTELQNVYGDFAKELCAELQHDPKRRVVVAYQPQYNYEGICTGVEALLRWQHPIHGSLYPPLVIRLAEEGGFLPLLEETVIEHVLADRPMVLQKFGQNIKVSFNVTGTTVVTQQFLQFCRQLNAKNPFKGKNLCVEVTEQAMLTFGETTRAAFDELHDMGLLLAIDDFSMGQTSINYLKENLFDVIKLDGSLVRGLQTHQNNCREIISSIAKLATSLGMTVVAEYVETEEQRDILHEIGCDCYQGYLYSAAVFLTPPEKQ